MRTETVDDQTNNQVDIQVDINQPIDKPPSDEVQAQPYERMLSPDSVLPLLGKYGLLPQLRREMLIDEAIGAITCTEDEMEAARQQFLEQNHITSDADLEAWLEQHYLTAEHLEEVATRRQRIEKFKQVTWGAKVESYFLQRKFQLDQVIYSLIRTRNWNTAQELYFRIEAGEQSFGELAREYSEGSEASTDGLVGPVELSVPHPVLAQRLAASQPGHLHPPSRIGEWVVIVRMEKLLPAKFDDAMRQRLLNELFGRWLRGNLARLESAS
ncbi:peptidylprolyl isomerase [Leptolyngbya sp. FACHB-36]|uniref:peptidylprolyl isomerase n=1 Tax=Leptolyngbya sp. FACHB-36 TaxID=2692808 RepID=UPI001F549816|nr:peptidylprolyl isomerase [Leptolyngbya sp. FACHB-36]